MRPARSRLAATLRTAAAAVALGVVMAGGLMLTAGPAAAHGADSAEDTGAPAATVTLTSGEVADDAWAGGASSNYLVTADRLPDVDGLRLEVRRAGTRLVLTNPSPRVVVILDQRGDPFVRVGPDGTFENVGAADDVRWVRRSAGHTVAWTDGRARWKSDPPPAVTADPGTRHTLLNWRIPVEVDGVPDVMSGTVQWVPPPSVVPAMLVAAVAAAAVAVTWRRRRAVALWAAALSVGALETVHVVGRWAGSAAGVGTLPSTVAVPLLTTALLVGAAVAWRSDRGDATRLAAAGSVVAVVTTLITCGTWLTRSQVPSSLGVGPARLVVGGLVGVAGAVLVLAVASIVAEHDPHRLAHPPTPRLRGVASR